MITISLPVDRLAGGVALDLLLSIVLERLSAADDFLGEVERGIQAEKSLGKDIDRAEKGREKEECRDGRAPKTRRPIYPHACNTNM